MPTPNFAVSVLALAVAQAFSPSALAQSSSNDAKMTEVVVSASRTGGERAAVAGFSDTPLMQTPASVSVLSREQMQDLNIRSTTDAAKFDASISDSYNAVGYAEQFSIRGFKLNNANSYRKDGMAISGDTQIPLENKERLEVLKGLAGLQAGVAAPGGIVNYVTKRPTNAPLRSVTLEASERGTLFGAVDLGGRFEDKRFGYRVNAAAERLRSYIKGADGHRNFVSGAFDWQITPQALLQIDADYQKKSQVTAPGFQLISGTTLPNVAADNMLNNQPWSKPVETESSNIGLRFQYEFNQDWSATISANRHTLKRDDYTAFPLGCYREGLDSGFCANGDYDVYDYVSLGEKKKPQTMQAMVQGKFATGTLRHELTAGYSYFKNSEYWGDYIYEGVGTSNIYRPVVLQATGLSSGPVSERRNDQQRSFFAQDVIALNDTLKLHAGARHVQVKRHEAKAKYDIDQGFWLPNVALVFSPNAGLAVYGSYAQGLELGSIAPKGTSNEKQALPPGKSKQLEAGVKADVGGLNLAASIFQITKGLEFTDYTLGTGGTFVRSGEARHRGVEFSAQGKLTSDLLLGASATALNTHQEGTGQPGMDGKRVPNVAKFKSTVYAEYAVPQVAGLKLNANWQYSGNKAFDDQNKVMVPAYHLLNLGAAWATSIAGNKTVLRAQVNNVTNKFYWRDVTPDLGGYLFPGAERTFKLSAQIDF
ncbi:TonB-dependent siderophore receptor [Pseudoduganella violacea]|uniref:Iron complex outermembrane receptor protein n=1 Tax=Pseudoduganella violacea TaxID=1715466 RepID=A0A7W5FWI1_9BURK|nr:TonB-dependent siderophore receptor [Pseudoduganella violacea]MBB3121298.1 iron complex outermembrane receptor protein [Pseudoduganella violacea]